MTSETRTMIEARDITGIEIECEKCHVRSIFPISSGFKIDPFCPHCDKRWFDETTDERTGESICPATNSLGNLGSHLWALGTVRTDVHAKIRLHLATSAT